MTITTVIPSFSTPMPNRNTQTANEFSNSVDVFLSEINSYVAFTNSWSTEANALAVTVNADKVAAALSATEAEASAELAASSSNFEGDWNTLTGALTVPSTVYHASTYWQLLVDIADVTASEPSYSNTDWAYATPLIQNITKTVNGTLLTGECNNSFIDNYGQPAPMALVLPTAIKGLGFVFQVSTGGAGAIYMSPASTDKIYLDGVAFADGGYISHLVPVVGDYITLWTFQTGPTSWDWIANSGPNAWT